MSPLESASNVPERYNKEIATFKKMSVTLSKIKEDVVINIRMFVSFITENVQCVHLLY